jgi:flagellar L-ring protein FlgH
MTRTATSLATLATLALTACGGPPPLTPIGAASDGAQPIMTRERAALAVPAPQPALYAYQQGSLWNAGPTALLGDRRARTLGDILTVAVEIDEKAEIRNSSEAERSGSQNMEVEAFLGLDTLVERRLAGEATLTPGVAFGSESEFSGGGQVRRNEKLTLRVAATVVEVLPNGHLVIQGDQEVRVNNELRDLQVAGIVRPEDISRYNEIGYDKIAGARIVYGGRGLVSDQQQPRYGQRATDRILPF